ncbi:MAG: type VI secretion system protein ImpB [Halieaceae bacterium]|jgi:type VI secretion system protein ImpB
MAKNSVHDKLKRVRKPRVHITYEVETNGAQEERELPFVVGVMGDYSGDNAEGKKSLKERKFVNVDRDNFDESLGKIAPSAQFKVDNKLGEDGTEMAVDLKFKSMEDFEPERVVEQVEPLRKLMEARNQLRDLLSKADRSEELESVLEQVLQSSDDLAALSTQLGLDNAEDKDA